MDNFGLYSSPEQPAISVKAREAAAMLGISESSLSRLRKRGQIRAATLLDDCVVYAIDDLKKLVAKCMEGGIHAAH